MDSKASYYVTSTPDDSKSLSASSCGDDDKYSPRAGDDDSSPRIISLLEDDELGGSRSRGESSDYYRSYYGSSNDVNDAKATRSGGGSGVGRLSSAATTAAMTLDLSGFHRADGKKVNGSSGSGANVGGTDSKDEYLEPAIQEKDVLVVFDLPDGSQGEKSFKYGHTIELLKSFVEGEYGIPMSEQCLYLDDRKLDNPFSLLDYPEVKGKHLALPPSPSSVSLTLIGVIVGCEEIFIRVEGNLPQFSKK